FPYSTRIIVGGLLTSYRSDSGALDGRFNVPVPRVGDSWWCERHFSSTRRHQQPVSRGQDAVRSESTAQLSTLFGRQQFVWYVTYLQLFRIVKVVFDTTHRSTCRLTFLLIHLIATWHYERVVCCIGLPSCYYIERIFSSNLLLLLWDAIRCISLSFYDIHIIV